MSKSLKEIIKAANRYEEVLEVLNSIISDTREYYPVCYTHIVENGSLCNFLKGDLLRDEVELLHQLIEVGSAGKTSDKFRYARAYFNNELETKLHNFGINFTHSTELDYKALEEIRVFAIIDNMLSCWDFPDNCDWSIPDGWRKIA